MIDVICIGEMVIDFIPGNEASHYIMNAGGAPSNVSIAVARNGYKSGFIGKLGNDDFGRFLINTLLENNVKYLCKNLTNDAITTLAFVTLDEKGDRSFTFARKPGADMFLSISDIDTKAIDSCQILHAGSCSLSAEPAAEATGFAMRYAHEVGRLVSFDVNYRELLWNCENHRAIEEINKIMPYVDFLKISEEEIEMFGGEDSIRSLMQENKISLVIETLGPKGAKAWWKNEVIQIDGLPGDAVDATGAGDAFWGACLSSFLDNKVENKEDLTRDIIKKAMDYGNIAGTLCVRSKGAISSLPTKKEILNYLDSAGETYE